MNKLNIILAILLTAAVGYIAYQNMFTHSHNHETSSDGTQLYTCGMHPDIISDEPGNCPICEMKLTPVKSSNQNSADGGSGVVEIDPVTAQNMNVKIRGVETGSLTPTINTNGLLQINETKEYHVNARTEGWVEKLFVNYTGQKISAGEKLLEIYSPKLITAQKEYLLSLEYKKKLSGGVMSNVANTGDALIKAAHEKLIFFGMTENEIAELKAKGAIKEYVSIISPSSGTVMSKNVVEGQKILPGEQLFHIADLTNIWVIADIYENEISFVKLGSKADVSIQGIPNETYSGKVTFIYPTVNNKTHTAKVRIELSNRGILKPGMIADVELAGSSSDEGILIPESAVIQSGKNNFAVVALGSGKFEPVQIELGTYASGKYLVLKGLGEYDNIVTSAQFLIDSESNLKAALDDFTKPNEDHSGHSHAHAPQNQYDIESPLIRTGVIDVESIDENADGKLFECPMDWDIISDEDDNCPACGMRLEEYTLDEIKENLDKFGYEYKK